MRARDYASRLRLGSCRGGLLVTALLLSAIIGLIALPSYLLLSRSALKLSHRGFYNITVVDLAETGLEQAMWAVNAAAAANADAWTGWTKSSGDAWRKFSGFSYGGGVTGEVNVYVSNYAGPGAVAVAKASITLQSGEKVEKWMQVKMKGRGLFAYGLLVRDGLTASGGAWFDSWISDPDNNPATASVPYSSSVARDNAPIASVSTATPSITLGSADLYGTVALAVGSNAGLSMSWGGQVGPRGMPISGSYNLAPGALTTGFSAEFQTVTAPTNGTATADYVLPYTKSVQYSNQWSTWYQNEYVSAEAIGTTGGTTVLQMNKLTVEGAATLTIRGNVTIFLPPSGAETVKIAGSGKIVLDTGASLAIYTPGNIDISGAGITNPSAPQYVQIWGTTNGTVIGQTIKLNGSGALNAVIYAPDAALSMPGGTNFGGAAVVKSVAMSGSGAYHYDESLKNVSVGSSGSVGIESYAELDTSAKRSAYAAKLAF